MRVKVAVTQMTSRGDVDDNLATTERLVRGAAEDGAKLVVMPECFAYLGRESGKLDIAEPLPGGGPILERCQRLARDTGAELVLGGFWETGDAPERVRNACVHLGGDGEVRAVYRKIHLFDVSLSDGTELLESKTVEPGREPVVTDTCFGKLGLSVCYDLRFPELYRRLIDDGAVALAIPSAFTLHTGKDHWHPLLRARAIESEAWVLAAAQFGKHNSKRSSYGHALIADPWGTVVAEHPDGEGFVTAWLDTDQVDRIRRSLPSLDHRRLT